MNRIRLTYHTKTEAVTPLVISVTVESISFPLKSKAHHAQPNYELCTVNHELTKAFGQLVQLGFDVAVFTPAAYQRRSLRRP